MAKFCGNCGNMASDEARVCGMCGTPFVAESAPAPVQYEQPQTYYQQMPLTPAPAPKKSKKGLVIGGVVAIIAIIVAVVIAVSSGGGSSKGEKEEKNSAKSVASKAASYIVDGDVDGLVDYMSPAMIDFACDSYGYDEDYVKDIFKTNFETYTEAVNEIKEDGYKVTYKLLDYEESPEFEEIQEDVGDNITEVYIYEAEFSFEDSDGYVETETLEIMVWKNDGEWEFVAVSD